MREIKTDLKHHETSEAIIGGLFQVYNELGLGFLESVYERALALALTGSGHSVARQHPIQAFFRGHEVGFFRADLIVDNAIMVEIKTVKRLHIRHSAQLVNKTGVQENRSDQ